MGFKLRVLEASTKFSHEVNIHAIKNVVSPQLIDNILETTDKRELRLRKLGGAAMMWFCIALNLYVEESYSDVLSKLVKGLRYIWRDPNLKLPGKSALCAARKRLGTAPVVALYRQAAKPLADLSVAGAYLFGLRLMAIDGTIENLPDTPELVARFGRHPGTRGDSAFPPSSNCLLDRMLYPCGLRCRHLAAWHRRTRVRATVVALARFWDVGVVGSRPNVLCHA